MKLQSVFKKIDSKEVITCLLLIVVGYMTAQLFMRRMNGFRVGAQCPSKYKCATDNDCEKMSQTECNNSYYTGGTVEKMCGYGMVNRKQVCHGTSNLLNNASCSKCKIPGPGPPGPPNSKTSWNCNASTCVSVSGTNGSYTSKSECQSDCGATTYSCNASTSKCEIDTNGSYTNASDCQKDCGASIWTSWWMITIYIVFGIIIIGLIGFAMSSSSSTRLANIYGSQIR
jgi:hypothetical protein